MARYVTLRYVTDWHVCFNVTLRFLTLRYVTWGWKTRVGRHHHLVHVDDPRSTPAAAWQWYM